jgi:hypothetical protein
MNREIRIAAQASALLLAAFLANCGVASAPTSVSWQAKLDAMPDAACVKGAIAATYAVSLADYKHVEGPQTTDRYLIKVPPAVEPAMDITFSKAGNEPVGFTLAYGYSGRYEWANNTAAHALIKAISSRCGVPELAERATRTTSGHWSADLGNV